MIMECNNVTDTTLDNLKIINKYDNQIYEYNYNNLKN